jgi:hypothetical protein
LIKQTVSDSFIRLGHSSSLKNTFKILDFGFSTLVRKGPVVRGLNDSTPCTLYSINPFAQSKYGSTFCSHSIFHFQFLMAWHRPHLKALIEAGVDMVAFDTIPAMAEGIAYIKLLKEFPGTKAWLSFSCKVNVNILAIIPLLNFSTRSISINSLTAKAR